MKYTLFLLLILTLVACNGGGGGSPTGGGNNNGGGTTIPSGPTYSVSGSITYESVPITASGLNYAGKSLRPVRNVNIQARNSSTNALVGTATTNDTGDFTIAVPVSVSSYYIAVLSQMSSPAITVEDNTNSNAVYLVQGTTRTNSGDVTGITMNLPCGWSGTNAGGSYSGSRFSAPFHILDTIYTAHKKLAAASASFVLPALKVNWSVNNVSSTTYTPSNGNIGTSHFDGTELYILGKMNNDSDEFDSHVVVHEWGHFVEANISRADSIGGQHGFGDQLNISVAFGEGWGNALSAIVLDPQTTYLDSMGARQQTIGVTMDIEGGADNPKGWFSEASVQQILFDIYDPANELKDLVHLGVGPIIDVLAGPQKTTPALTSIFSFISYLKAMNAGSSANIDTLVDAKSIHPVESIYGLNEDNDGGDPDTLPIYNALTIGAGATSIDLGGGNFRFNEMQNSRYFTFTASSSTTRLDLSCNDYCEVAVFKSGVIVKNDSTYTSKTITVSTVAGQSYVVLLVSDEDFTNGTAAITASIRAY